MIIQSFIIVRTGHTYNYEIMNLLMHGKLGEGMSIITPNKKSRGKFMNNQKTILLVILQNETICNYVAISEL